VVLAGTVMPLSVIVEHDIFEALAAAAFVKVQEIAPSINDCGQRGCVAIMNSDCACGDENSSAGQ
jgi:hypothetical protein